MAKYTILKVIFAQMFGCTDQAATFRDHFHYSYSYFYLAYTALSQKNTLARARLLSLHSSLYLPETFSCNYVNSNSVS